MKKYLLLILTLSFFKCGSKKEESMDFLEPQPSGINNAQSFNKKYQGRYFDSTCNTHLLILSDKIIQTHKIPIVLSRKDVDSAYKAEKYNNIEIKNALKKDQLEVLSFKDDSIYSNLIITDTIFTISKKSICRYLRNDYFLNETEDNTLWKVQLLHLNKNTLSLGLIFPNDSLFAIMDVKEKQSIKNDTGAVIRFQIKPSKKELKRLIKNDMFEQQSSWVKEK